MINKAYLNLPVRNGAPMRAVTLDVDGRRARAFQIELADGDPDWWAPLEVRLFNGRPALLAVDGVEANDRGLGQIVQSDSILGAENLYDEPLRPRFHFSPKRGWCNDPNGLVYHAGEWHLFYQHNPYGVGWGNMHWGHAVSRDLVHWEELPIALYPVVHADGACFSGSAVVDARNTAGFQVGPEAVMIAIFSDTAAGEAIAYSTDRGRSFTRWEGNPVLKHGGRDPKVFWHEPTGRWVMAVFDTDDGENIAILTSHNLKHWELQCRIPGYYECPELFELPVEGEPGIRRWIVYGGDGRYAVGVFDGRIFRPEHEGKHRAHYGSYYASQTFNNAPDGRRVQIGWAQISLPGMPFNQMMSFPTELSLRRTDAGLRLFVEPVAEIERLHGDETELLDKTIGPGESISVGPWDQHLHVKAIFEPVSAEAFGIRLDDDEIAYDAQTQQLMGAPLPAENGRITLEVLIDRPSIEVSANGGRIFVTGARRSAGEAGHLTVFSRGGATRLVQLRMWPVKSGW